MAEDYTTFLAAKVLNDNTIMTYRLLSRELKVHVNRAKENADVIIPYHQGRMLFDFHDVTNKKTPGSCHATYVICGHRKPRSPDSQVTEADGDVLMQSSPFQPQSSPFVPTQQDEGTNKMMSVVLVPEEDLQVVKDTFKEITSIHMYSIEPTPVKDLLVLADSTTDLYARFADDEPAYRSKTYGTTHSPLAKRRPGRKPIAPGPMNTKNSNYVVPVVKVEKATSAPSKTDMFASSRKKEAEKPAEREIKEEQPNKPVASSKPMPVKPIPGLKRGQSDLMNSFGKTQPKKAKKPDTPPPEPMELDDDDDDEEEDEDVLPPPPIEGSSSSRKIKKEAEAELRRMMDDDDDPIPDVPAKSTPMVEPKKEPVSEEELSEASPANPTEAPKRKRARRKVTKKVTSKDEEGYLVTKTETAWESYSEDEASETSKPKSAFSTMKSSSKVATKKAGNIADFFGKKT